jgi:putative acetyltransferase
MIIKPKIRPETARDFDRIKEIIITAFEDHPYGYQKEDILVSNLRNQGALAVSLVAEYEGKVIGHIAFSEVTINGDDRSWYGLAPLSVDPDYHNQGVGSQLVLSGLEAIKKLGAEGCVLVGEPEYYGRFGFKAHESLTLEGIPAKYFLALSFIYRAVSGEVAYHKAFEEIG